MNKGTALREAHNYIWAIADNDPAKYKELVMLSCTEFHNFVRLKIERLEKQK